MSREKADFFGILFFYTSSTHLLAAIIAFVLTCIYHLPALFAPARCRDSRRPDKLTGTVRKMKDIESRLLQAMIIAILAACIAVISFSAYVFITSMATGADADEVIDNLNIFSNSSNDAAQEEKEPYVPTNKDMYATALVGGNKEIRVDGEMAQAYIEGKHHRQVQFTCAIHLDKKKSFAPSSFNTKVDDLDALTFRFTGKDMQASADVPVGDAVSVADDDNISEPVTFDVYATYNESDETFSWEDNLYASEHSREYQRKIEDIVQEICKTYFNDDTQMSLQVGNYRNAQDCKLGQPLSANMDKIQSATEIVFSTNDTEMYPNAADEIMDALSSNLISAHVHGKVEVQMILDADGDAAIMKRSLEL